MIHKKIENKYYYLNDDDSIFEDIGIQEINGKKYYFNEDNSIFDQIGVHNKDSTHFVVNDDFSITMQTARVKSIEKIKNYSAVPAVSGIDLKAICKEDKIELIATSNFDSISEVVAGNYSMLPPELISEQLNRNIEKDYLEIIPVKFYKDNELLVTGTFLHKKEVNYKTGHMYFDTPDNLKIEGILDNINDFFIQEDLTGSLIKLHIYLSTGPTGDRRHLGWITIRAPYTHELITTFRHTVILNEYSTSFGFNTSWTNFPQIKYKVETPPTITTSFNIWGFKEPSTLQPIANIEEILDGNQQLVHQVDIDPEELEYEFVVGFDDASNLGAAVYKITLEYVPTE